MTRRFVVYLEQPSFGVLFLDSFRLAFLVFSRSLRSLESELRDDHSHDSKATQSLLTISRKYASVFEGLVSPMRSICRELTPEHALENLGKSPFPQQEAETFLHRFSNHVIEVLSHLPHNDRQAVIDAYSKIADEIKLLRRDLREAISELNQQAIKSLPRERTMLSIHADIHPPNSEGDRMLQSLIGNAISESSEAAQSIWSVYAEDRLFMVLPSATRAVELAIDLHLAAQALSDQPNQIHLRIGIATGCVGQIGASVWRRCRCLVDACEFHKVNICKETRDRTARDLADVSSPNELVVCDEERIESFALDLRNQDCSLLSR